MKRPNVLHIIFYVVHVTIVDWLSRQFEVWSVSINKGSLQFYYIHVQCMYHHSILLLAAVMTS